MKFKEEVWGKKRNKKFQSDYRGGKAARDINSPKNSGFDSPLFQSFHQEVNDAGKKMNHLRQHTERLWQVSTSESDTGEYQKKD